MVTTKQILTTNQQSRFTGQAGAIFITPIFVVDIIRLTHANVWESMGKPCSCMQFIIRILYYQITRESVPGTMCVASEHAMKSKDKIITTTVPSCYSTRKYITHLLLTDGSKFSRYSFVLWWYIKYHDIIPPTYQSITIQLPYPLVRLFAIHSCY